MSTIKETITLVPKAVLLKAKEQHALGSYEIALDLLTSNSVMFDIYSEKDKPYHINVRVSSKLTNLTKFQDRIRKTKKQRWEDKGKKHGKTNK